MYFEITCSNRIRLTPSLSGRRTTRERPLGTCTVPNDGSSPSPSSINTPKFRLRFKISGKGRAASTAIGVKTG